MRSIDITAALLSAADMLDACVPETHELPIADVRAKAEDMRALVAEMAAPHVVKFIPQAMLHIAAIRVIREHTGCDLRDAKAAYNAGKVERPNFATADAPCRALWCLGYADASVRALRVTS